MYHPGSEYLICGLFCILGDASKICPLKFLNLLSVNNLYALFFFIFAQTCNTLGFIIPYNDILLKPRTQTP